MIRIRRRRMRLRKPVKRWKTILLIFLLVTVLFLIQTLVFIEYNLRPIFLQVAESYSRRIATEAINDAISKKLAEETDYKEIVQFYKDDRGNVRSAVFNLTEANRIKSQTTDRVQTVLREIGESQALQIKLPIGQAFHSTILAAAGPIVPITITPLGTAKSDIKENSETLGINQTKHTLMLDIEVQVNVIIPFVTKTLDLKTEIPIASFVVVGDVPSVFYDATGAPFYPPGVPIYPSIPSLQPNVSPVK